MGEVRIGDNGECWGVVGVAVATLYIVSENNEREIIFAKIKDMFIKWKIMRR